MVRPTSGAVHRPVFRAGGVAVAAHCEDMKGSLAHPPVVSGRTVDHNILHQGRFVTFCIDTIETPDGERFTRDVVLHPGAAAIVPITDDQRIYLVSQWRQPLARFLWEIPAGTLEPGEDPAHCAQRELEEETGLTAATWRSLGSFPAAPGYSSELLHLFAATGLKTGTPHPDPDEFLSGRAFSLAEVQELMHGGELDLKSITALALSGIISRWDEPAQ